MSAEPIELPVPDEPFPFNLDLSDEQRDIRDWVHGFAADVVRPAASEWDERGGDAVADHRRGGQDRPLRLRGDWRSSTPTPPA